METCKRCGVNKYDPWFSKDKGQKFPFKSCPSCREKAKKERDQQQGRSANTAPINAGENGQTNTLIQVFEELQAIHQLLERYLPLLANKDVVKSFEPKTVSEDETPDVENIPW